MKCTDCKRRIWGSYVTVEGLNYHKGHEPGASVKVDEPRPALPPPPLIGYRHSTRDEIFYLEQMLYK